MIVKTYVFRFFKDFHSNARLSQVVTSSFLTLIPKLMHTHHLNNHIPICLVSCLQKILDNVLEGILKLVFQKIISRQKSAFVPGRNIFNGILVVSEI